VWEREQRVVNALQLFESGQLSGAGIFVVRGRARPRGAIICLPVPGAGGLVWPPQAEGEEDRAAIEDALAAYATAWLRQQGVKVAQSLLISEEVPLVGPLERNGFRHVTSLLYMRHVHALTPSESLVPERLTYRPFEACEAQSFQQTLLHTYEETLDCPEVTGVREIGEVLEGHRAQGREGADHWWLVLDRNDPVGVLLATESDDWTSWDVAYVGVVPEARRHGVGREIVRHALRKAREAGADRVTLSVDSRNAPALRLYQSLGFERYDRREVYLAIWPGSVNRGAPEELAADGKAPPH
jgi:ribosomal protein S18 acetylase RimI-like enzyme